MNAADRVCASGGAAPPPSYYLHNRVRARTRTQCAGLHPVRTWLTGCTGCRGNVQKFAHWAERAGFELRWPRDRTRNVAQLAQETVKW